MATFSQLLAVRYPLLRSQFPIEGRRKIRFRLAEEFWSTLNPTAQPERPPQSHNHSTTEIPAQAITDRDPFDDETNGPELGILLRTDYSNEDAWRSFLARLQESEKDLVEIPADSSESAMQTDEPDSVDDPSAPGDDSGSESDDQDGEFESSIFAIINSSSPQDRRTLSGISNLVALRLLNDVDIRLCPARPANTPRVNPPSKLIDYGGWQEVYVGKSLWIYDNQSNSDQSVRVVSQQGDVYGTATADSWRARVAHICDLQINMSNGMKINFGGLDGWDHNERRRNMADVILPMS